MEYFQDFMHDLELQISEILREIQYLKAKSIMLYQEILDIQSRLDFFHQHAEFTGNNSTAKIKCI